MINIGDVKVNETVYIPFNTFDSNGAACTITDLVAGDIEIHKDGSITQRTSDAGVSVVINFDGITGNHLITIDTSDNTDAGFYAAGSDYIVRIEGVTINGQTVNAWVGIFSIANRGMQTGDSFARIGAAGAGLTALGDARIVNLDATVSSRLAPAGTLATVTNLTNAPSSGDFTATMKTSLNAATPASVQNLTLTGGNVHAHTKAQDNIDFGALQKASINVEILDVVGTDTISELAQGQPSATPTLLQAVMLLYMALRNSEDTTATQLSIKNDAGTVICKATLSDDGTTFTKAKLATGP